MEFPEQVMTISDRNDSAASSHLATIVGDLVAPSSNGAPANLVEGMTLNQSEISVFLNRSGLYDASVPFDTLVFDETCLYSDQMNTVGQFLSCLVYFLKNSYLSSTLVLLFSLFTVLLNIAVIIHINKLKQYKTVFDRIFIGHALVDGLVGVFVIPNYCIYTVFGYWPLGKLLCHFYVSLDYTICHVGILHMVFIAYCRLRSLQAPKRYHKELIISHAKTSMVVLWIISFLLWTPAVNIIINITYTNRDCYFNFNPIYIIVQDILAYLLPMFIIFVITCIILKTLRDTNKRRKRIGGRKKRIDSRTVSNRNVASTTSSNHAHPLTPTTPMPVSRDENSAFIINSDQIDKNFLNKPPPYAQKESLERSSVSGDEASFSITDNNNNPSSISNAAEKKITFGSSAIINGSGSNLDNIQTESDQINSSISFQSPQSKSPKNKCQNSSHVKNELNCYRKKLTSQISFSDSNLAQGKSESTILTKKVSYKNLPTPTESVKFTGDEFYEQESQLELSRFTYQSSYQPSKRRRLKFRLNAFAKLYIIIATFCILWLPFCLLWPIYSICRSCISIQTYQISYWMGYAQSLINPILLLILNPNYNKLKATDL